MGYNTDFKGSLRIDTPLTAEQVRYIQNFNESRRMKRDVEKLKAKYGGQHSIKGYYGIEGEFFAYPGSDMGQTDDGTIVDNNIPPRTQPGFWCGWTVTDDGSELVWDEGEKFYNYVEWLQYLFDNFFIGWGKDLNGVIQWQGQSFDDRGKIIVTNNKIITEQIN